jgi:hypothetical protein
MSNSEQNPATMRTDHIEEMQGLYGPYTLTERVVQKIWLRQDFATDGLQTAAAQTLLVKDPGRWNLQEGPDFKEARLLIDGVEITGDVEIHFNLADWHNHQHEADPNFDRVVLHVVLHPGRTRPSPVQTSKGHVPATLFLLPVLNRDLESCVMDEALLELEKQDELEWVARFIEQPLEARLHILHTQAEQRWSQKMAFAQQRLAAAGWAATCHQYALEVLGYARNRAPMSRIASMHSLADFNAGALSADQLYAQQPNWKLSGLRPANHPRQRLRQYLSIIAQQPNWPDRLAEVLQAFPAAVDHVPSAEFRKMIGLSQLRKDCSQAVFSDCLGERRLNTLMCDAILPLATAAGLIDGKPYWLHWPPGDAPAALARFLKHASVTNRQRPCSNGWSQGALALFHSRGT